jgi:hypothetical protein
VNAVQVNSGELCLWIAQGSGVHLRAVTEAGAPLQLSSEQTRDLALKLLELAELAGVAAPATW